MLKNEENYTESYWHFNDGASSLVTVAERLELNRVPSKDASRIQKSKYKNSYRVKYLRRAARRKRKGFQDKPRQSEGVMYASGAFGDDTPGPSKCAKH